MAHYGLQTLLQREGVPLAIVMDGSKEQTLAEFRSKARQAGCRIKQTEPYSPWQNAAEGAIRELKKGAGRKAAKAHSPAKLWDHCLELEAMVRSHTSLEHYELQGQVPETLVSGQTADISPIAEHGWYDWVKYYDQGSQFPDPKEVYGRWLGPAPDIGPAMASKVLKANGQVIVLSTYRGLSQEELDNPEEQKLRDKFDLGIKQKLGDIMNDSHVSQLDPQAVTPVYEKYSDEAEGTYATTPDIEDATPEYQDSYIGADVVISLQGKPTTGKVKRRARTFSGDLYGKANDNPILDTSSYEVEFPDGRVEAYTANVIAENMWSQCDPQGNQFLLLDAIVDHRTDGNEIQHADRFVTKGGRQYLKKTTKGWDLCVEWKDKSTSWERLSDLKESFPIEVAEYAVANGIDGMPAFAWWAPYVLKKRDRIIKAVNKR